MCVFSFLYLNVSGHKLANCIEYKNKAHQMDWL